LFLINKNNRYQKDYFSPTGAEKTIHSPRPEKHKLVSEAASHTIWTGDYPCN
jgi:hypothetical protein